MTLQNTSNTVSYIGDGSATIFAYSFPIPSADDVEVTLLTIATSSESDPLPQNLYSISGLGDDNGGNVTYPLTGAPLSSDYKINIRRVVPTTQDLDLTNQSSWLPEELEKQLDRIVMQTQQLAEEVARAVKASLGSGIDPEQLIIDLFTAASDAIAAASAAQGSASTASSQAGIATSAAATATTKAGDASNSASEALGYRNEAEGFRDTAEGYKDAASGFADDASGYASAASGSAGAAEGFKDTAVGAAGTATTQAGIATTKAGDAESARAAAVIAQGGAEAAEAKAEKWAENPEDTPVELGKYSALHWAAKAEESASTVQPLADQINGATNAAFEDTSALVARKADGSLLKQTWGALKTALNSVFLPLTGGALTGNLTLSLGPSAQYSPQIQLVNSYNGYGSGYFYFQKNRNGGPVVAGDGLGNFLWSGFNNGAYVQSSMISALVVEVGTTTVASKLQFDTSVGTNARSTKAAIYAGLYMLGTADPGVGNINAVDYYDNGVNINTLYLAVADVATSANFLANASNKVLRTTEVWSAAAYVNLGSSLSGNLTLDFATFINAYGTATGNITFNAVSNAKDQSGLIEITASGGDRTVGFNTTYFCTPDNTAIASIPSGKTVAISYARAQSGKILLVRLGEVA